MLREGERGLFCPVCDETNTKYFQSVCGYNRRRECERSGMLCRTGMYHRDAKYSSVQEKVKYRTKLFPSHTIYFM